MDRRLEKQMRSLKRIIKPMSFATLLLLCLFSSSCAAKEDFDARLDEIVRPHLFNIAVWEASAIPRELNHWIFGKPKKTEDEISIVTDYFAIGQRIKTLEAAIEAAGNNDGDTTHLESELDKLREERDGLENKVERIIKRQIIEILREQGIFNPVSELKIIFPPLNFTLENPPRLLVVSPRDRIESIREFTLQPGITLEDRVNIEASVDALGVSSLVVGLGGLGATYPTFVTNRASLRFTIEAATEEWLHQYLVLKPLGFLYLLDVTGISRDYDIATINETVAGIVSQEIAVMVLEKYYPDYENDIAKDPAGESGFDFNREMREIRQAVDAYLARGEIEPAEQYMEEKRQYLCSMGYYIRKLNQAYFAFHGTYADEPAFISPIGLELQELREQSHSLKDFLYTVAKITSRQDLSAKLE